jgi:DNA-binding IclR family transcriptional regulator
MELHALDGKTFRVTGYAVSALKNRPAYAIGSVDSALLLATLLRLEGPMGVSDAARHLGVAPSTAPRLLGMGVKREFAAHLPHPRNTPAPGWRDAPTRQEQIARLREVALPQLRWLVATLGESANLMVLSGRDVRFVATVECERALRVSDRTGRVLPAHRASGGKALLAAMSPSAATEILGPLDDSASARLRRELRAIRRHGFAVNDQETEAGLTAVGLALPDGSGTIPAALSIAMPTVRFTRDRLEVLTAALSQSATAIASAIQSFSSDGDSGSSPAADLP